MFGRKIVVAHSIAFSCTMFPRLMEITEYLCWGEIAAEGCVH